MGHTRHSRATHHSLTHLLLDHRTTTYFNKDSPDPVSFSLSSSSPFAFISVQGRFRLLVFAQPRWCVFPIGARSPSGTPRRSPIPLAPPLDPEHYRRGGLSIRSNQGKYRKRTSFGHSGDLPPIVCLLCCATKSFQPRHNSQSCWSGALFTSPESYRLRLRYTGGVDFDRFVLINQSLHRIIVQSKVLLK